MSPAPEPSSNQLQLWNKIGLRAAYGQMMLEIVRADSSVIAASADLGRSSGLDRLVQEFPDNYLPCGIAEQNMVGMSAGLAHSGFRVFASSFAPFLAFRAAEQVRLGMGYMKSPVNLVGLASGFSLGYLGATHYGLEDISIFRSISGIEIFQPGDALELWSTLNEVAESNLPAYVRLTGSVSVGELSPGTTLTSVREGRWLVSPGETVVVSSGVMTDVARKAINVAEAQHAPRFGLFHTPVVRPFPASFFSDIEGIADKVVVIEEHSAVGGMGDEIRDLARQVGFSHLNIQDLAVKPGFPHGDTYENQLTKHGLDAVAIAGYLESI